MLGYVIYPLVAIVLLIVGIAIWIKVSLWIMGLGVDDDGQTDWPWRKD